MLVNLLDRLLFHPAGANKGKLPDIRVLYLQTFGQRAEQHQMKQSPQSSWHRGRLFGGSDESEKHAGIFV